MSGIVVLAGGLSVEREVSLRSGRRVAEELRDGGLDVTVLDADAALLDRLAADPPDLVVPLLHGAMGEDGALRDVLDCLGIRYLGSGPAACRLAYDKPAAKSIAAAAGIAVPEGIVLSQSALRELGAGRVLAAAVRRLGLPLVVKPAAGGSAFGVAVVDAAAELPAALVGAYGYGPVVLLERFVGGDGAVEVAVPVLDQGPDGPRALPVVEIRPQDGSYDYAARYTAGLTEFVVPADLPPVVLERCADAAVAAHRALGLRDWSRVDLIVDPQGVPWFLEANVAPGMTETSTFPLALQSAGLSLPAVITALAGRPGAPDGVGAAARMGR